MTRKDTILIAVVINAGLLAILFTTAVIYDTDKGIEQTEFVTPLVDHKPLPIIEPPSNLIATHTTGDEVDNVLKYYHPSTLQPIVVAGHEIYETELLTLQNMTPEDEEPTVGKGSPGQEQFVEVKIKKGDVLEKIARAHKTTIEAIKRANQLENERLSIGQVLKIPVNQNSSVVAHVVSEKKIEPQPQVESIEPVYYVVKSGDNPWKIAKQYNVKFEDILHLNHLNEEKARNLKVGDRIRVK